MTERPPSYDLTKCTFIIPLRIETADRMRNITTSLIYLLSNFDTNVIVKEFDSEPIFDLRVVPMLEQILPYEKLCRICLLYTSPSPRDVEESRMPSSA